MGKFKVGEFVLVAGYNDGYVVRKIQSLDDRKQEAQLIEGHYATTWQYKHMHKCPKSLTPNPEKE